MNELSTKSLAQIVKENYRTVSVFEKYNLDFCCKGKRSLQQACTEIQLPMEQVITELENITTSINTIPVNFNSMSLTQLTDYIVMTHHAYVKHEMPSIFKYLQKVTSKHGQRHPVMYNVFEKFTALQKEMIQHMEKEELVIFPLIKALERTEDKNKHQNTDLFYLQSPITMLEEEHDHAGHLLEEIRELTTNYTPPADACTTYRLSFASLQTFELDLHRHVHLENHVLFPKALNLSQNLTEAALN